VTNGVAAQVPALKGRSIRKVAPSGLNTTFYSPEGAAICLAVPFRAWFLRYKNYGMGWSERSLLPRYLTICDNQEEQDKT
jgi:hypothetical protein